MDKTIGISELRKSIASIIVEVNEKGSRYIIMQHSRAKAVLVSPDEMETLEVKTGRIIFDDVKGAKEDEINKELSSYEKFFGKK